MLHLQNDAHEIDRILGAELLHDVPAMHLYRSPAYPEIPGRLLIRGGGRYLAQHLNFPARELVAARKISPSDFGRLVLRPAAWQSRERRLHALDNRIRVYPPFL